ncbi:MAG: hypothetical protein JWQ40_80 [Segetibacter sp.]|nr:hypothetical protein [Segetibacter sp.]
MALTRKITNSQELQQAMKDLEKRVQVQELDLKVNYNQVKENLQPKRVVKNTFSYVAETPEIQRTLVNTVIGFILGYASKKAVELLSEDSLNSTVENLVNYQVSQFEQKHPESLLSKGITLFRKHTPPHSPIYPFVKYK